MEQLPVFVINGFLEAGKTQFMKFTMQQEYFRTEGNTLLIVCEEGDEEYDEKLLSSTHTTIKYIEDIKDFTIQNMERFTKEVNPERILIEWNGLWEQDKLEIPDIWFINQMITIYDTSTLDLYIKNRESLVKHLKEGTVDIALMEEYFIEDKEIKVIETEEYPFVVVAGTEINDYKELIDVPLLKRDTMLTNKYLDLFEKMIGFNLDKRISINGSIETMKNLIKNGLGFAVLPYYSVYEEVIKGSLNVIHSFDKSEDRFQIVLIRENEDKEGISKFIDFLKNYKLNRELFSDKKIR